MKIKIGVMASAETEVAARLKDLLEELATEIARRDCLLLTGATTGVLDAVSREARRQGCLTIGISPAHNANEHTTVYGLPADSCDIVIVVAGGMGTLNEFTIAMDEGKVVGVLSGTGGIADEIGRLLPHVRRPENVIIEAQPGKLLDLCFGRYLELKAVS